MLLVIIHLGLHFINSSHVAESPHFTVSTTSQMHWPCCQTLQDITLDFLFAMLPNYHKSPKIIIFSRSVAFCCYFLTKLHKSIVASLSTVIYYISQFSLTVGRY